MRMRKIGFLIIFSMCIILSGCKKHDSLTYKERENVTGWRGYFYLEYSEDKKNFCLLNHTPDTFTIIPEKYIVDDYTILDQKSYDRKSYKSSYYSSETVKFDIKIYDINTLELVKEIDFKERLTPYLKDYQVYNGGFRVEKEEGKYWLKKSVEKKQTEEEIRAEKASEYASLLFDVDTEEIKLLENDPEVSSEEDEELNIWLFIGSSILEANQLEDVRVRNSSVLEDTSFIDIPTKDLPEQNEKLYRMFPGLKTIERKEGTYAHIFLSPQTNNLEALSLILDDNEELDFTLLKPDDKGYYGTYGKNGELHYITQEEYDQFQKEYYEYREKERQERESSAR